MTQFIDWHTVATELTPTHLLVGLIGYSVVHVIIKSAGFCFMVFKGWVISNRRRLLAYEHHRYDHPGKFKNCTVGFCPTRSAD